MNLDHFRVFAVVAKHGTVTRASEELNITQPAVTNQLKLMEDIYGVRLYTKHCRGIEPKPGRSSWRARGACSGNMNY